MAAPQAHRGDARTAGSCGWSTRRRGRSSPSTIDARLRAALGRASHATRPENGSPRWRARWTACCDPVTSRRGSGPGRPPSRSPQAAETTVDKVMPYAAPVLAERAHVAQRAQRVLDPPPPGEGAAAGARTLGDAVGGHLRARNVDPETVAWDAWRREDGRWTLTGRYSTSGRDGAGRAHLRPARQLRGRRQRRRPLAGRRGRPTRSPSREPEPGDAVRARRRLRRRPRRRRRSAADAIELADDSLDARSTDAASGGLQTDEPLEAFLDDQPGLDERAGRGGRRRGRPRRRRPTTTSPRPTSRPRRPVKKTRGRASVPSWDEIMFGGGKPTSNPHGPCPRCTGR